MSKILIIEDDVDLTKTLRKILNSRGFDVVIANDSVQGTQFAHEEKPDLIILDLGLPGGGGLTTLRQIRMSSHTNWIPVIVLSAIRDMALEKDVYKEGIDGFIRKPYETNELIMKIRHVLGKPGGEEL